MREKERFFPLPPPPSSRPSMDSLAKPWNPPPPRHETLILALCKSNFDHHREEELSFHSFRHTLVFDPLRDTKSRKHRFV